MFNMPPPADDGLAIAEVHAWSRGKHHFLLRYIDAFTESMKGKPWDGLHYVDLFAGPGIERIVEDGKLEWGSPLIAAQAPNPFTRLHLCELKAEKHNALRARLERFPQPEPAQLISGNANGAVDSVIDQLPSRALCLAFLDPYGLHLDFQTVEKLSRRRTDLIIFFPDHMDVLRNWQSIYWNKPDSNLDTALGTHEWRAIFDEKPKGHWAQELIALYKKQIKRLGYIHFEEERISRQGGRALYKLVFCSRHPLGAQIWRGVAKKKPSGQNSLDFGQ